MIDKKYIAALRREFESIAFSIESTPTHPHELFEDWFSVLLKEEVDDPTACVLATVDKDNLPDTRVVLLKDISGGRFTFYTNYMSRKAQHLDVHPHAALNFYWPSLARQVRVRGGVVKVDVQTSESYFHSRPHNSQISVYASRQSTVTTREKLEAAFAHYQQHFDNESLIPYPEFWGGYVIQPVEYEFWQGRRQRLHDRVRYRYEYDEWKKEVLAP